MQDLNDLIKEYLDYALSDFHTGFPGVVTEYDANKRRATIQPSLKRRLGNGEYIALPLLINVPVQYQGNKRFSIHFPLDPGDEVAVFFSERAIELWKETGMDEIEDTDPRRFDLCDAYCTPGLQPIEFTPCTEKGLQILHHDKFDGKFISQVLIDDDKIDITYKEKSQVTMSDDMIEAITEKCMATMTEERIEATNGHDLLSMDAGEVNLEAENNATIKTGADATVDAGGNVTVKAGGNAEIEASGTAQIKSTALTLTGGTVKIAGTVAPTGSGALCAIPACLFTGAPHVGNTASGA